CCVWCFQGSAGGGPVANGRGRVAQQYREAIRFRKFARQRNRGRGRRFRRVAFGAAGSANSLQFSAVGSKRRNELVDTSARVHDWIVDLDRSLDGNLSGASGSARRFG